MARSFLEKRRNAKALSQLQEIEHREGLEVSTFAVHGTQKFEWSNAATIVLAVFMVLFVGAALMGHVIVPGGLVLFAGYNAVKPRRTVSLGQETVTVWEHSFWTSKITGVVVNQPRSQLEVGKFVSVPGATSIQLSAKELQLLAEYSGELGPAPMLPSPAAPPPPTPNRALV